MKLFTPRTPDAGPSRPATPERAQATLEEISARLDKLERVVTDLKQNIDLIPAIIRKLYLSGAELPPPYDLLSERFGYLSQNEEDGLLLALFRRIGTTDCRFVEIGCGMNGGNSGFLAQECGWSGLMVDAKSASIEKVTVRFKGHPIRTVKQRVTREGVNPMLEKFGFTGEIDLLSIDIDGMDYWVWEAVRACSPRVVAIEYNWLFGAERAVTIPYASDFDLSAIGNRGYRGASLAALAHLGRSKGYRLVATERVNAFFLRNDLAPDIREIEVARGYRAPLNITRGKDIFQKIAKAGLPLVDVVTGQSGTIEELAPQS
jgi:hypothetical protein